MKIIVYICNITNVKYKIMKKMYSKMVRAVTDQVFEEQKEMWGEHVVEDFKTKINVADNLESATVELIAEQSSQDDNGVFNDLKFSDDLKVYFSHNIEDFKKELHEKIEEMRLNLQKMNYSELLEFYENN